MSQAAQIGGPDLPIAPPTQAAGVGRPAGRALLPVGLRPGLRPASSPSPAFVRLHHAVEALRTSPSQPLALQLMAAQPGAGTSTVVSGLASAAAASSPGSILVVSCDERGGWVRGQAGTGTGREPTGREPNQPSLAQLFHAGRSLALACQADPGCPGVLRACLGASANSLLELSGPELRGLLAALGELFSTVLLDCPSGQAAPDAAAISRHCDGTVLVVCAERSRVDAVASLRREIERAGGHVVGAVLNRQRSYLPAWLDRLL